VGDIFAEEHQFRPIQIVLESLLTDAGDLPDWAENDAVAEKTEKARTALDALYESAWDRPPSDEECWGLVSAARKHCRWLV
jgi:hypothetical protein